MKKECIISPIFYLSNKKKLINKGLIDLFPKDINKFVDLFAGSGNLGLEALSNGSKFAYLNDFNTPDDKINISIIALAYRSVSDICIIPMQDWLGLDDKARMNTPSTIGENWRWRLEKMPDTELAEVIKKMAKTFSR